MVHHPRDQEGTMCFLCELFVAADCIRPSGRRVSTRHIACGYGQGPEDRVDGPVTGPSKQARLTRAAHSQSIAPRGCSLFGFLISFGIVGEGPLGTAAMRGVARLKKRRPVGDSSNRASMGAVGSPSRDCQFSRDLQARPDLQSQLGLACPCFRSQRGT